VKDIDSWMARSGFVVQRPRFGGISKLTSGGHVEWSGRSSVRIADREPAQIINDGVPWNELVRSDDAAALARVMAELLNRPRSALGWSRTRREKSAGVRHDLVH